MGFVRIFWKNNVQEAYLPKMSISGQIVSEILAQLCLENSIQTLLNFFGSTQKKLEGQTVFRSLTRPVSECFCPALHLLDSPSRGFSSIVLKDNLEGELLHQPIQVTLSWFWKVEYQEIWQAKQSQ